MKPEPRRSSTKLRILATLVLLSAGGIAWMYFHRDLTRGSPTVAATPKVEDRGGAGLNAAKKETAVPDAPAAGVSIATTQLLKSGPPEPTTNVVANTAPPPSAVPPLEPDEDLDYRTHYIIINGHRADPRHLLAKFKEASDGDARQTLLKPFDLRVKTEFALTPGMVVLGVKSGTPPPVANVEEAKKRGDEMLDLIKALVKTGKFEYVEPDYIRTINLVPSDAAFSNGTLWGLRNTGQESGVVGADLDVVRAWDLTTGSTNVIVAVIDTGIRYTHTDLATQMWRNPGEIAGNGIDDDHDGYVDNVFGINAVTNSGNPLDDQGHGTHCAGTIGAAANGGGQHVGVAWQVRLMACKFMNSAGTGSDSNAIKCINFAVSKGARILSNSWGGSGFNSALVDAITSARNQGVLFIAAAGNGGDDGVGDNNDTVANYPSNYNVDNVVAVAALDRQDKLAGFSNFGATTVDVGAPGVNIFSTTFDSDTSYGFKSGTSMATPHVAGVAALVLARFPTLTVAEFRQRIISTGTLTSSMRNKSVTGARVNAFNAVNGTPDGVLEVSLSPVAGTQLIGGTTVPFFVQVSDVFPVQNATVTGIIPGRPNVVFANDGSTPDVTASDHIYTASVSIPITSSSLNLQVEVTAPGKTKSTTVYTFPVRLPPANDAFANRATLTGPLLTVSGSNVGATNEVGEPNHAGFYVPSTVWWTWTAPANGPVTIRTDGSSFDTIMAVYTGNVLASLTRVADDDDSGVNRASLVSFDAISGTTYQIVVGGYSVAVGDITLNLALLAPPPPPANDNFADGTGIQGTAVSVTGSNQGATKQASEPNHAGLAGGRSVWWRWTAPGSGPVTINTDGSLFNTTLAVYTGASVLTLTQIASDNDGGEGSRSQVKFNAVSGTTYNLAVDGVDGSSGAITLSILLVIPPPAPANDNFASRITVTGASSAVTGTNVAATKETDEPDHAGNSGGKSVWWTWTPPSNGTAVITTAGSSFDTLLGVYTGTSVGTLTLVAGNDQDPAGGNTSRVTFSAVAGTPYQIAVDGNNTGLTSASGNVALNVAVTTPSANAANDNFANRVTITGATVVASGSNVGATKETGEPRHANSTGGKSVWWTWTAPTDGTATIKTQGSSFDTLLAVYTGSLVSALTTIAQNDDTTSGMTSQVKFNAIGGTVYQIAVDGFGGSSGSILLNISLGPVQPPPPNDNFANRIPITGTALTVTAQNGAATKETAEPNHASSSPSHSVWWSWTAPQTGYVKISTAGSDFDTVLAAYTGTSLTALTVRASNDESGGSSTSEVNFFVTANTTYAIAVDGWLGDNGNIVLSLNLVPSNTLYFTDFESFTIGSNKLAGTDGWLASSATGTTGIYNGFGDGSKTAWIGLNPTTASSVVAWRPLNYDPVAAGTPNIQFQVDLMIKDSTNGQRDTFYFLLYNKDVQILSGIGFDNVNQRLLRYDGNVSEVVGNGFTRDKRYTLTLLFDFSRNLWSASLGNQVLFSSKVIVNTGLKLTLGDIDAYWQMTKPGTSGDNAMVFDNYRISIATLNDAFASATTIPGSSAQVTGSNQGTSKETGEPNHAGNSGGNSVWWKWTAPQNGTAFVNTRGSNFDTLLGVYTGNSLNALTLVAANDDEDPTQYTSAVAFSAVLGTTYLFAVDGFAGETGGINLNLSFTAGLIAPAVTSQPQNQSVGLGSAASLSAAASGTPSYRWQRNGADVSGATSSLLSLVNVQPSSTGLYTVILANAAGSVTSQPAILGLSSSFKLVGLGTEFPDIVHPATGFTYDQILLAGSAATVTADSNQILRTSYIDLNDDIVQVEFSGPGALSLVLDAASGPAIPAKYNQAVNYMKGHAGIVITGATENTHLSVFSVGTIVNGNPALYRTGVTYDGLADLAFVAISSSNGKFGGLRSSNASYFNTKGYTGIYAPGVQFTGPVFVGDINASDTATPIFVIGSGSDLRITGGDLLQSNGRAVQVGGITQLKFMPGSTSHGVGLPAQVNRGRLEQNGIDVTTQIVVNPTP